MPIKISNSEYSVKETTIPLEDVKHVKAKKDKSSSEDQQAYYIILRDNSGCNLSYNFNGSYSQDPYTGFEAELPVKFRKIVEQVISSEIDDKTDFKEYIAFSKEGHTEYSFLITLTRQPGTQVFQYLIRENGKLTQLCENCKKHLSHERKLSRINFKCISSVSHDFRTPLSIIYANLQLLEYHDFQLDKETIEDAFSLSRMAVKSLLRVLDKVTVVDSVNKGKLECKASRVNVRTLCQNLSNDLNEAEVLPDRVRYLHDEQISEIETDEYLFKSMFTSLIFNALSFSKKNSNVIFESLSLPDGNIRFIIKDSGIGLASEQLESLRVYFADLTNNNEMIGLGLAIARECLFLLRGKLTIISEPGKGSEFIIDLPVSIIDERGKHELAE